MSERSSEKRRGRRGIVVIMLSMMVAVVMLPLVGLAVDGSILYLVQAKLSAGGGRSLFGCRAIAQRRPGYLHSNGQRHRHSPIFLHGQLSHRLLEHHQLVP